VECCIFKLLENLDPSYTVMGNGNAWRVTDPSLQISADINIQHSTSALKCSEGFVTLHNENVAFFILFSTGFSTVFPW